MRTEDEEFKYPERTRRYEPEAETTPTIGFKVVRKRYREVSAIFAETGQNNDLLLRALHIGHGILFDALRQDPFLYFVVSQTQMEGLAKVGVIAPTFLQLLGSCEVIATTEEEAIRRFRLLKEGPPTIDIEPTP